MRWRQWAMVLLLAAPLATLAADDEQQRAHISAATANAVESLRKQISDSHITDQVTVKDLLDRTGGTQALTNTLFRSQQIGGPRWLDDQTCQVRLEISASRVVQSLQQIAASNPRKSPISAEQLAIRLRDWEKKSFSATGTSTGAAAAEVAKPSRDAVEWSGVNDADRKAAIAAAKRNATTQALETVASVPLTAGKTLKDALAVDSVRQKMESWLSDRPITQVEFRDDQKVRVSLSAPAEETFEQLRSALAAQQAVAVPKDEPGWLSVKQDFVNKFRTPVGLAPAAGTAFVGAAQLPRTAPDWVGKQLDAEASASAQANRLLAAGSAEADARVKLRAKLDALTFADGKTVGDAAKEDANFRAALTRAIARAKRSKVTYELDGGAKVRVSLDLRSLWDDVQELPIAAAAPSKDSRETK